MTGQKSTHVSEEKKKIVADLTDLVKKKKTILIASIKNIPGSQLLLLLYLFLEILLEIN